MANNKPIQLSGQKRNETAYKLLSLRSLKARVLSPTHITAYIITFDIAAKLNGSQLAGANIKHFFLYSWNQRTL